MIRIVKMTFNPSNVEQFLENFNHVKDKIRAVEGVNHLELLHDKNQSNILFTYSIWESEEYLMNYRNSDLFKSVWAKTKPLFSENAEAWSVDSIVKLN